MKRFLLLLFACISFSLPAERIYIMNSPGYNEAEPLLINAIIANGHTVDVNLVPPFSFPAGFTTTCVNPVTGYDWLCLFGNADYSTLLPQIQAFIDAGGKVFCQYEVSCCTISSGGTAALLAGLTGLPIVTNIEDYIALSFSGGPGWEAEMNGGCITIQGNAYKGLDNVPAANQFVATGGAGSPAYTVCTNFGFHFTTTDFVSGANNGAITGLGDVNAWYDGAEPGAGPVNAALVDFFFPNSCTDTCIVFPLGCILETPGPISGGGDVNLGNDTTLCTGSNLNLNASSPGSTYLWQDGSTNATFTVTTGGLYWVEVTSPCFGIMTDSIVVNYVTGVSVDLGNDTTLCPGATLNLDVFVGGTSYLWQDGSTDSSYTITAEGIYWVQVGTLCGTPVVDSIVVDYIDPITVDLGNDTTLCTGDVLLLDATTTGASYEWQNGSTAATFSVSAAGLYWVEVDNSCSTFRDSINITYVGGTSVDLGNDTSLCAGQTLQLDVFVNGTSYLWQDGSTDSSFTVTTAGIYWVQVGTHCGTTVTDSIEVDYINNITLDLGNDTTLCAGQILLLNATTPGAMAYEWEDSTNTSTHLVSTAGVYTVVVTGACNTITESIEVFYVDPVTFDFGHNDTVLCNGDNLVIGETFPGATYLWQDGSTASTYLITGAGTYWVIAQVSGCTVSDTLNVIYVECNPYLQMPNIFSPNGDGNNDVFRPLYMVNVTSASMAVFNRWGQQVFSTDNPMEGWDGNFSGKECVEGTYFWVLTFTGGINNEFTDTRKGTVTLVR